MTCYRAVCDSVITSFLCTDDDDDKDNNDDDDYYETLALALAHVCG